MIRPATPLDIDAIGALAHRVWQDTYPAIISQSQIDFMLKQRYDASRLLEELAMPDVWWELASVDGNLAAFASSMLADSPGEMKLDKLYVDPAQQRLGLGGRLIAQVVARAQSLGCSALILAVNKRNKGAIQAYQKHGFVVRDSVSANIGSGFVMDDFIMAKSLASNSG